MPSSLCSGSAVPRHEQLAVGLALAFAGGFFDAYTYLIRGGVFANAQTGNIVLMSLAAARGDAKAAAYYLLPICAFFLGVLISEWIKAVFPHKSGLHWMQIILLLEAALVLVIGFVPISVPHALVNTTVSLICSLQVNTFRRMHGLPYATTMCTGNLRSAAESFCSYLFSRDRHALESALRYFAIIGLFCAGGMAGALLTGLFGIRSVWLCGAVLLAVLSAIREKESVRR